MDLLTQGLVGASVAGATYARTQHFRKALAIGLLSGLAADIDIFITSDDDPLLNLSFHRHFTHSIFFVPLGALILSLILYPFFKRSFSKGSLYSVCFFGFLPSGLLDACTSYGTTLLWPLTDQRFSFNIISIIDPIFTLVLFIGLMMAILINSRSGLFISITLCSLYLVFGTFQKRQILDEAQQLAKLHNHSPQRLLVKPSLGNLLLWRAMYQHKMDYYVYAIRHNPLTARTRVYSGGKIPVFDSNSLTSELRQDSILLGDIQRFQFFSDDYLAMDPATPEIVIDARYSNLPHLTSPLWGLKIDIEKPQEHATFEHFRDRSKATRDTFIQMLRGQDIHQ